MTPSTRSVLSVLPKARLVDLARGAGVAIPVSKPKDEQIDVLLSTHLLRFADLLQQLGRDELRAACRAHGLDDHERSRPKLAARLLEAHGAIDSVPPRSVFRTGEAPRYAPRVGDIVAVRHRQWLVEGVTPPPNENDATLVRLVCLDDDNQGRALEVLWELELGARVLQPEAHGLSQAPGGAITRIDPPRHFGAYLHALKWNSVTATDAKLFQAPFRAGIQLLAHQLTPLQKALLLPRANLFIADDVGLGKTIEAGLVLQELLLRQRVEFALIVCPASVALQWRDEMSRRFGLHFEVMNRAFIARRRQERGFGVNPWGTHNRFIISHQTLRRPEYQEPLLQHLSERGDYRAKKSLLILDEAHVAAPASATKYAIDSRVTKVIRGLAPRFENRLFLSATPHNGHSNSFSALLEILDPQRFTRGVRITDPKQLEAVMVRRLKADLRKLGSSQYPERKLVEVPVRSDNAAPLFELDLARLLAEYTRLMQPAEGAKRKGRGRLVFVSLQKRLLSSVEAFHRTLHAHARAVAEGRVTGPPPAAPSAPTITADPDLYGEDDDALDDAESAEVTAASSSIEAPAPTARELLEQMLRLADQHRGAADGKARALLDWIRTHQCTGVTLGGATAKLSKSERTWSGKRVLIFTEYGDTKRWLQQLLSAAVDGTDDAESRIMTFHGGMSDEQREEVQRAFNSPPDEHPVRILIATDAAREGVNLQGHCADLFHFDIPWNPARLEQRNGRIDRTLQPSPEVRCHYFVYPDRAEDVVLKTLVHKVDVIQRELGSLGAVLMERMEDALKDGITPATDAQLAAAEAAAGLRETTKQELESQRDDVSALRAEVESAGVILERSRAIMDFDPALLRDAIDVGLELAGAGRLRRVTPHDGDPANEDSAAWALPDLPDAWQQTLDSLRPPRRRDEPLWEYRKRAPEPVVFRAPATMNSRTVHLHLQHPVVQRVMGRFLAQGYSAHDLSRVTIVRTSRDSLVRVIGFGRLSLFGPGATRLHDQLISVAARWIEGGKDRLKPFAEKADRDAIEHLEAVLAKAPGLEHIDDALEARVAKAAPALFADLWPHIRDEADARAKGAETMLAGRAREEADALRGILARQREAIEKETGRRQQLAMDFADAERDQEEQWKRDREHMEARLRDIQKEIETEPTQIEALYKVVLRRLEPVGLVVLWPETRG